MTDLKKAKFSSNFFKFVFNSSIFRIVFLIDLFFFSVAFCDLIAWIIHIFLMLWGGLVLIHNYLLKGVYKKIRHYKIILIFISSCFVTVLLHVKDNLLLNLLYLFTYLLCFFVFYGMHIEKSTKEVEKEMLVLFKILVGLTSVISFAGLVFTIVRIQERVLDYYWLGIYENRLIGIYTNSNLLALFCVIAIIGTHIIFTSDDFKSSKNKKIQTTFYVLGLVTNVVSLVLSDSNGAFIFFLIYLVVILFYYLFKDSNEIDFKVVVKNGFILVSVGIFLTFGSFYIRRTCQDRISILINDMHQIEEPVYDNKISTNDSDVLQKTDYSVADSVEASIEVGVDIGRVIGEDNYDGSSGRKTLIKQAIIMFKKNPIMGIGIANIPSYGEKYISGGLRFPNFHNGYITILVSWGIVGFFIFVVYSLLIALRFGEELFEINKSNNTHFPMLFAFLVGYCIYSLVEITLLSDITFTIFIFWAVLGYATSYIIDYEKTIYRGEL